MVSNAFKIMFFLDHLRKIWNKALWVKGPFFFKVNWLRRTSLHLDISYAIIILRQHVACCYYNYNLLGPVVNMADLSPPPRLRRCRPRAHHMICWTLHFNPLSSLSLTDHQGYQESCLPATPHHSHWWPAFWLEFEERAKHWPDTCIYILNALI